MKTFWNSVPGRYISSLVGWYRCPKQVSQRKVLMRALVKISFILLDPVFAKQGSLFMKQLLTSHRTRAPSCSFYVGTPCFIPHYQRSWHVLYQRQLLIFNSVFWTVWLHWRSSQGGLEHRGACSDYSSSLQRKPFPKPPAGPSQVSRHTHATRRATQGLESCSKEAAGQESNLDNGNAYLPWGNFYCFLYQLLPSFSTNQENKSHLLAEKEPCPLEAPNRRFLLILIPSLSLNLDDKCLEWSTSCPIFHYYLCLGWPIYLVNLLILSNGYGMCYV